MRWLYCLIRCNNLMEKTNCTTVGWKQTLCIFPVGLFSHTVCQKMGSLFPSLLVDWAFWGCPFPTQSYFPLEVFPWSFPNRCSLSIPQLSQSFVAPVLNSLKCVWNRVEVNHYHVDGKSPRRIAYNYIRQSDLKAVNKDGGRGSVRKTSK